MSTYCVGDIHGCFAEFLKILKKIKFNPKEDLLLLTGDLIGRGPNSVETIEYIMDLSRKYQCIHAVLGNHDLNFIAVAYGIAKNRPNDRLNELLNANNLTEIIEYLCSLPLLYLNKEKKIALSHAGVYPAWGLYEAQNRSKEISLLLNDPLKRKLILRNMYGNNPAAYDSKLADLLRWRFIINSFTRMRLCDNKLNLDFVHRSLSPQEARPQSIFPWFNYGHPSRFDGDQYELFFGHWSALKGQCYRPHIHALDTGCVWGNYLSGICVETGELFKLKSKQKPAFNKK